MWSMKSRPAFVGVLFMALVMLSPLISHAEEPESAKGAGRVFVWYDGQVKREVHLQPQLVAEFNADTTSPRSTGTAQGLQKMSGAALVKRAAGARIFRVSSDARQKMAQTGLQAGQSQVFADGAEGGPLRALPGGILVTFKGPRDAEWVRGWAERNGLVFEKMLPVANVSMALFSTPSGLVSLEIANRTRGLPEVASSEPNWWTEKWKGSDLPKVSPQDEPRVRESRKNTSRRFVD